MRPLLDTIDSIWVVLLGRRLAFPPHRAARPPDRGAPARLTGPPARMNKGDISMTTPHSVIGKAVPAVDGWKR